MKKGIIIGIIALVLVIVAANSVYTVAEDEYACVFRFSEIVNTGSEAGLHLKVPFIDSVEYFSKATQLYDIPPSEVLTSDKQNMTVDCYILWSISDPQQFYRALGTTSRAEERLNALTYNTLKTAMGTLAQADIINMNDGAERNRIYEGISTTVDTQAKAYKLNAFSGEKDPDFYYGEAIELTLKELRTNIDAYNGVKVAFKGIITKNNSNTIYIEDYDSETDMYYGMTAPRGWEWFNSVRNEERFKEYIERAKKLAGKK